MQNEDSVSRATDPIALESSEQEEKVKVVTLAMPSTPSAKSMFLSTMTSLAIVVVLLLTVRWVLPPLLESSRYSWYRGQLRAEYEAAGEQLKNVSLDGLSRISELVSQRVTPSVVHIRIKQDTTDLGSLLDDHPELGKMKDGQGSGVIIDESGYVLTNFHVIEDGEMIEVVTSDNKCCNAQLIGWDRARDIAVLKIDSPDLPPIKWGDSDGAAVGSPVWAIGSPFGLTGSITFGILSSKHRIDLSDSRYQNTNRIDPQYSDLMQSDVAINPGNSGGPLVNGQGQLIGINTAILGETYRGVSFSIPSNIVKTVYEEIRDKAQSQSGWLGVMLQPIPSSKRKDGESGEQPTGAFVAGFARMGQSPGRIAGLQIGDIIKSINGQKATNSNQLIEMIKKIPGGTTVDITLERQGESIDLKIPLGIRPIQN